LALVGPSGQGKSTMIQLIERYYDPSSGSIEFEGQNLKDLNIKYYRDQISLVSQEPTVSICGCILYIRHKKEIPFWYPYFLSIRCVQLLC